MALAACTVSCRARHPLVRTHPHTGRRSLHAVSGSSYAIEGFGEREGVALLDDLKRHATGSRYCHTPTYRNGDVVIWDNCSLLHSAPLIDPDRLPGFIDRLKSNMNLPAWLKAAL